MSLRSLVIFVFSLLLLTACSSSPVRDIGLDKLAPRKAEQALASGLKSYENGNYALAAKQLKSALDNELTFKSDQVMAHKYLAFVHCASDRKKQCRAEFVEAFEIDPDFELSAAEMGHPLWGPVYRDVQAQQRRSKKK